MGGTVYLNASCRTSGKKQKHVNFVCRESGLQIIQDMLVLL